MADILKDRREAGQKLAEKLLNYQNHTQGLVLALPRGGVPVGFEIAQRLHLPLDVFVVRKLGVPKRPELAMGAIATGDIQVINRDVIQWLDISAETLDQVAKIEQKELERRHLRYRGSTPFPPLEQRCLIVVDDGIATGSTLKAAIIALKRQKPAEIIIAVPVASPLVCQALAAEVKEVICLLQPASLTSISLWYEDFTQVSDEEVMDFLQKSGRISCPRGQDE